MPNIFPHCYFCTECAYVNLQVYRAPDVFREGELIFGGQNDNSCKTYPLVFVALRRDLEIAGGRRRNDRQAGGNGARHCADDRRCAHQPDGDRRDCWHSACDCGVAVVFEGNILKNVERDIISLYASFRKRYGKNR